MQDGRQNLTGTERKGTGMNWVLVMIFVSVAGENRAMSTTTIPMETEKICSEAKDKLKKSYQETHAANWFLVSECLRVRSG
jgi:hypothetical protein